MDHRGLMSTFGIVDPEYSIFGQFFLAKAQRGLVLALQTCRAPICGGHHSRRSRPHATSRRAHRSRPSWVDLVRGSPSPGSTVAPQIEPTPRCRDARFGAWSDVPDHHKVCARVRCRLARLTAIIRDGNTPPVALGRLGVAPKHARGAPARPAWARSGRRRATRSRPAARRRDQRALADACGARARRSATPGRSHGSEGANPRFKRLGDDASGGARCRSAATMAGSRWQRRRVPRPRG